MERDATRSNLSLEELDRQVFFHPNTDLRAFAAGELGDPAIVEGAEGIELRLREPARGLMLQAVANPATGETVGSTSQFEATAPWLKETRALAGEIIRLEIRGATFSGLPFSLKSPNP